MAPSGSARAWLLSLAAGRAGLAFGVVGETLPVDYDARFVSDDPCIMPRCHDSKISRSVLHLFAVVHDDLHPARNEVPHVGRLATVGVGNGLDMLGPLPTGLKRSPADGATLNIDYFNFPHALLEGPSLLWRVKTHSNQSGHLTPFCLLGRSIALSAPDRSGSATPSLFTRTLTGKEHQISTHSPPRLQIWLAHRLPYEEAMQNSSLPQTDALSRKMWGLGNGPPTFHNLDVIDDTE